MKEKMLQKQIKNTHHSSGFGVNVMYINNIEHDECMMSRQELVRVLPSDCQMIRRKYDE